MENLKISPILKTYSDDSAKISEEFRILRTNIKSYFLKQEINHVNQGINKDTKIITITSALSEEGKTLTAANLAITLAKDLQSNVLLIDSDLRNGSIHEFFYGNHTPGLSEILIDKIDFTKAIYPTAMQSLFYIPRGEKVLNPSEILGSLSMRLFLNELKEQDFSYIIIDSPPIIPFTDAGLVGIMSDGIMMVIKAYSTTFHVIKKALTLISHVQANMIGFILTESES